MMSDFLENDVPASTDASDGTPPPYFATVVGNGDVAFVGEVGPTIEGENGAVYSR